MATLKISKKMERPPREHAAFFPERLRRGPNGDAARGLSHGGSGIRGSSVNNSGKSLPQDCATSNYARVIHNEVTWKFLQKSYIKSIKNKSYEQKRKNSPVSGFLVNVVVKDDGYRGRSVYTAQDISEGTRVWKR